MMNPNEEERPTHEAPLPEEELGKQAEAPPADEPSLAADRPSEREPGAPPGLDLETPLEAEPEAPSPPGRFGRFLRGALRWSLTFLLVFLLGVAATWWTRLRPLRAQAEQLQRDLESAQSTIEALEGQVQGLEPLKAEKEALQAQLDETQLHVRVLQALVDVTLAQAAVASEDAVTAQASLSGTDGRLRKLKEDLPPQNRETLEAMRTRLALVLDELEGEDVFSAEKDLEVLANNLRALERSLFKD
jgi:hypothetical protein